MENNLFIERLIQIHGNNLFFNKTKFCGWGHDDKTIVTCPKHGDIQIACKHLLYSKQGCKYCKNESQMLGDEECIKRIKIIHGDKYDYSKVKYNGNKKNIILICPVHGEFNITPQSIFNQHSGCQKCGYKTMKQKNTAGLEAFIEKAQKIHGNNYDYSQVIYVNNKTNVHIKCNKCKHEFDVRPDNHINLKSGCPKCRSSKMEEDIKKMLDKKGIEYYIEYKDFEWLKLNKNPRSKLRLDFYLPQYNIAIECQGHQHFYPVDFSNKKEDSGKLDFAKIQKRDKTKLQLCKEHNIKILYYSTLNKYDSFLNEKIYHTTEEILNEII